MTPTTLWRIEMLGGLRIVGPEGVRSHFPSRKAAGLLAYLALKGDEVHPREILAEIFWPDTEPQTQRHNLRMTLSRLRSLFAPETVLETDRFAVRLMQERFTTDVAEFERAVERRDAQTARRLYRGDLLAGFYEDWVMVLAARLSAQREEVDTWAQTPVSVTSAPAALPLPRLFGFVPERNALQILLSQERLITITGMGGAGKTRLAREVARSQTAVFVPLADCARPEQVVDAIRFALTLPPPSPGFSLAQQVGQAFAQTAPPLLILDSAEHLLERDLLAHVVIDLLEANGSLVILVTSRRVLGILGEAEFPLLPLPLEDSMAMFEHRAHLVRAIFAVTDANRDTISALCRRLDGLPLAIELAAARTGVLSVQEILERVSDRYDVLAMQPRLGVPERHQSLRAALQSSFDLLTDELQRQFTRLSVFRGGCTAESAAAVAGIDLVDLDKLLQWSLLLREEQLDGTLRFRMLEALREFAGNNLPESERVALGRRHAEYFRDWAEANRSDEGTDRTPDYLTRLERQGRAADNVRAAIAFCCASEAAADKETGLRLVTAFWTYWYMRNLSDEMVGSITRLLEGARSADGESVPAIFRARTRLPLAMGYREHGDLRRFAEEVEEALSELRQYAPDRHLAYALHLRGLAMEDEQRHDEAESFYLQAEAVWEAIGDRRNAAATQHNRALAAVSRGDLEYARLLCSAALAVFRPFHETAWIGVTCMLEAAIHAAMGDMESAVRTGEESLANSRLVGYTRGEAEVLRDLSRYQRALGNIEVAEEHARAALSLYRKTGDPRGEAITLLALSDVLRVRSVPDAMSLARECFVLAEGLQDRYRWTNVGILLEGARRQNVGEQG